jgi:acyl-CoA synthetase (AMP-forming)/AMP-acid ligase II
VEVSIVGDDGAPLTERRVGEVVLSGRMVAAGYASDEQANQRTFRQGLLYTGDCCYLADGELYVTGRKKDLIIHAGKNYFPQDLEVALESLEGVERAVAFGSLSKKSGTEEIVVWVGTKARGDERGDALIESCRRAVLDALGVAIGEVVLVHPTNIPKTTSGKLRRAECRRAHEHARGGAA